MPALAKANSLRTVAVVGEQVRATTESASDAVSSAKSLEAAGNSSRSRQTLKGLEVDGETGNVGRSHGCTAERSSSAVSANVGRQDGDTGGEDVDAGTVVGERSGAEAGVSGRNGEGVGCVGGGLRGDGERVAVQVAVAGGDDGEHALGVGSLDGVGPGRGGRATEGQVDDGAGLAGLGGDVADGPVETGEDGGGGSRGALEDLDGDQVGLLSDTVGGAADGASNVGAVAESVGVGSADSVVAESGTAAELGVGNKDTGVDDVCVSVLSSGGVVDVRGGGAGAVADGTKTPSSTSLGGQSLLLEGVLVDLLDVVPEVGNCVGLDKGNLRDVNMHNM